jgi:hypothetical protein
MILQLIEAGIIKVLEKGMSSQKSKDKDFLNSGPLLGLAQHPYDPGKREKVFFPERDRLKHIYILGSTGSGKTKLIESFIRQDILGGQGFALIDAHGDLSQNILKYLAYLASGEDSLSFLECLSEKLILIEPFNPQAAIGFNPLEANEKTSPFSISAEFMGIFKKIWQDAHWGPRMEELLRNAFITLSESGLTLLEAVPLLTNAAFREKLVQSLGHGEVKDYWVFRYGSLSDRMQAQYREPVLNRLSVFTADPSVRLMIGQAKSSLDFRKIMDEGKWLIINLSKGHLRENLYLLGALFVAKLKLSAMSRVDLPENARLPFTVYVDEFQNFIGEDFETILSEARKYGLSLCLAHQNLNQVDLRLRASILGNVATQIFFRLSHHDASALSAELDPREKPLIERRLIDFRVGQAYLKRKGEKPRLLRTMHVPEVKDCGQLIPMIKDLSLANYARPKKEVEEEIERRRTMFLSEAGSLRNELSRKAKPLSKISSLADSAEGWNDW